MGPHMSRLFHVCPTFPSLTFGLTKENKPPLPIASGNMASLCLALSPGPTVFSPFSPWLHGSKTLVHSCIQNAFHKRRTHARSHNRCPIPKRVPEATNKRPRRLSEQQGKYPESPPRGMTWFPILLVHTLQLIHNPGVFASSTY